MWKKVLVLFFVILFDETVNAAMRKSWKSQTSFETNVPRITPTESTTATVPPQPTKISAKIKASDQHIADLYSRIDSQKGSHDFGSFAYQLSDSLSEEEVSNEIPNKLSKNSEFSQENVHDEDVEDEEFEFYSNDDATEYKVGKLMNVSLDSDEQTVNVNLDQQSLKEIITGRGRKHSMLERVVPLFILPFLIQAAVVPFMVTTIKLFLLKSLFAGKIAILFFLLGALKSHQNSLLMKQVQAPPLYLKDYPTPYLPERRIETSFDGYKVEGKPESYIN